MPSDPEIPSRAPPASRALDAGGLEGAVGFWLRLAQQQDLRRFNEIFAEAGVSQLAYSLLLLIGANPGRRQADLGAALHIRQPNLVEPIEGLIARGLVRRRPDPDDGRAQTLALTPEGEALLARLRAAHDALLGAYRERLGSDVYDQLVDLLRRFVV
jgi:DNA-binding MarR family transcriptional regulator